MTKLHLGCGNFYMEGFVNIDYPQNYTVQNRPRKPDIETDFTKLTYDTGTIDEIQLHHVFEHFQRQNAIALLCTWNKWLKPQGTLVLSMPDIKQCIRKNGTGSKISKKPFNIVMISS